MDYENKKNIGSYLEGRIQEARGWSQEHSFHDVIGTVKIRDHICRIRPIAFIERISERERHIMQFWLIWEDKGHTSFFSNLDVRIAAKGFLGPEGFFMDSCRGSGWPYISLWAVGVINECITYKHVNDENSVRERGIKDFFKKWTNLACMKNNGEKIFRNKQRV